MGDPRSAVTFHSISFLGIDCGFNFISFCVEKFREGIRISPDRLLPAIQKIRPHGSLKYKLYFVKFPLSFFHPDFELAFSFF